MNFTFFKVLLLFAMLAIVCEASPPAPREKRETKCCSVRCRPHEICAEDWRGNPTCKTWYGYCDAGGSGLFYETSDRPLTDCSWWTGRAARAGWNCFIGYGESGRYGCRWSDSWGCGHMTNKYCGYMTRDDWFSHKPHELPYC